MVRKDVRRRGLAFEPLRERCVAFGQLALCARRFDGGCGLARERFEGRDFAGVVRANLRAHRVERAKHHTLARDGCGHHRAQVAPIRLLGRDVVPTRFRVGVGEHDGTSFAYGHHVDRHSMLQRHTCQKTARVELGEFGDPAAHLMADHVVTIEQADTRAVTVRQRPRDLRNREQRAVDIQRLLVDALGNTRECGFAFDGGAEVHVALLQFVEQARVLDRDQSLIGEGFEQADLRVGVGIGQASRTIRWPARPPSKSAACAAGFQRRLPHRRPVASPTPRMLSGPRGDITVGRRSQPRASPASGIRRHQRGAKRLAACRTLPIERRHVVLSLRAP